MCSLTASRRWGGTLRSWVPASIYSEKVYAQLPTRMRGGPWDERFTSFS